MMHQDYEKMKDAKLETTHAVEINETCFYCYRCGRKLAAKSMIRVYGDNGISFYICPEHLEG